jgi:hypothetical protein
MINLPLEQVWPDTTKKRFIKMVRNGHPQRLIALWFGITERRVWIVRKRLRLAGEI